MKSWETLEKKVVLRHNKFLTVESRSLRLPDGRIIPDWPWLITPDFVNIVAVTDAGKVICFRQDKYAVEGISLGPPGGFIEPGEKPLDAAKRELREETGYEASSWEDLGSYRVDPNRGAGTGYFFLARNAKRTAEPVADDLESQEMVLLSPGELKQAVAGGGIKVLAWVAVVSLALARIA